MDGDSWAVDVVQALAIPVTVLIAAILLRGPLSDLLRDVRGRVRKLSVGPFSVELAEAKEIRPPWTLEMNGQQFDVRQLSPADIFDSFADSLLSQLAEPGALDYVVVDLGGGKSWLTTRLFLFADLLTRMRGLRAFVFVHGTATIPRRFLGVAPAGEVRWCLAQAYPELEAQLAHAYCLSFGPPPPGDIGPVVVSKTGALEQWRAGDIARTFLDGLQQQVAVAPAAEGWVEVRPLGQGPNDVDPNGPRWERARWIDVGDALRLFDGSLSHDAIVERDNHDISRAEQVAEVVACDGDFVAVLRGERFDRLIDRRHVVDQAARRFTAIADATD